MEYYHNDDYIGYKHNISGIKRQLTLDQYKCKLRSINNYTEDNSIKKLIKWIVESIIPISIIGDRGLK